MFSATIVTTLVDKLQNVSTGLVYSLIALLVFGEAALFIGFILPGETAVIIGGVIASRGHVNIGVLCVIVVVAAIVGDSVGYEVGQRWGHQLLQLSILRRRRKALERALDGLRRRGTIYVFVGRFTAFLRAVMPGLAGMSRMPYRNFLGANALGAAVWGVGYCLLGYYAGHALNSVEKYSGWGASALLVLVVVGAISAHYYFKARERKREALDLGSKESGEFES